MEHATDGADPPQLVLASASPRRRDLLEGHGYRIQIAPAAIVESDSAALTVRELVLLNAWRKASAVSQAYPDRVVLGVDTLVSLEGRPLGKPANRPAAAAMLGNLAGREHQVYSGVCLIRSRTARPITFAVVTRVTLRELSARDIATYLDLIDPLDKAGGYAAQEHGERIIARTSGSWSNIMGLPMETLASVLAREFSIRPERAQ